MQLRQQGQQPLLQSFFQSLDRATPGSQARSVLPCVCRPLPCKQLSPLDNV